MQPAHREPGLAAASGWAHTAAGAGRARARRPTVRLAPPRGSGRSLPRGRPRAQTARMTGSRLRRRSSSRAGRRSAWSAPGWRPSSSLVYVVVVVGGGALLGQTSSPERRALGARDGRRRAGLRAGAVPAGALGVARRARRPAPRRTRCCASSPDGHRQLPRRGAARRGWPGCWPRAPARSGPRCGWSSATGSTLAATWPPTRPPGEPTVDPARTRPGRRRAAGAPGGRAARRPRSSRSATASPLTPVEERLFAGLAAQAGLVLRGARLRAELEQRLRRAVGARRGAARSRASGWSTRRTPSAAGSSATSTTAPSSTWSRSRSTCGSPRRWPPARPSAPTHPRRAGAGRRRRDRHAGPAVARHLPAAARATAGSPRPARPRSSHQPAAGRASSRPDVGRFAADVEAAAYFCCLEALQNAAKHAQAPSLRVELRRRPRMRWRSPSRTTARASTRRRPRPAPGWPTCATASSASAARSCRARAPGSGTRDPRRLPAGEPGRDVPPASPGRWPG